MIKVEIGCAYHDSPNKISKVIQNTSGVIILAIIALLVLLIIGYKRKNKMW